MRSRFHLPAFMVLLFVNLCPALSQDIRFNKVPINEEAISGFITSITQDLDGNIWFSPNATGLVRYDGKNMKTYSYEPLNPNSLASNYVESIYTDKTGNIWAGTYGKGLDKFDPKTGIFTHFRHNEKDSLSISGDTVTCILQDREGFIWVGTQYSGLNRLDPQTGKFIHYRYKEKDANSLSFDQVRVIYEDKKGDLWIGTGGPFIENQRGDFGGLNRLNKATGTFTRYLHDKQDHHSLIDNRVRAILEDSHGNFWVGTAGDGLHTMNREKGTFERLSYDPVHPEKLSRPAIGKFLSFVADHITFLKEDSKGAIWIGTMQAGLMQYDPVSRKINHFYPQKENANNLTDSTTFYAYASRDGNIWMSTWGGDFYRFDPSHQNIHQTNLSPNGGLWSFLEEPGNIQWFGTDNGLFRIDKNNNTSNIFKHDPQKPGTLNNNVIYVILKDKKKRIWVGSNGGINLWNQNNQSFTSYKHDRKISSSLSDDVIYSLYEDKLSNFWVGTLKGLDRMNIETGEFTHYKPFPEDTIIDGKNVVTSIKEDSQENLWIGTGGGLHIFNRNTKQFKNYLTGHNINQIFEDRNHKIWVPTTDGLYAYNKTIDSFLLFIDPATGRSMIVLSMVEDSENNLWTSSNLGICRINKNRNEVTRFGKYHDVNPRNLRLTVGYKTNDGQLIFGNIFGYYSFYPDKLLNNKNQPEIIFTDFRIGGNKARPDAGKQAIEDIIQEKQIELRYDQNVFSFLFNIIHYSNPDGNKAIYMLENYEKDWRPTGTEGIANYYNIPPGNYTFRIKAGSSYGIWTEKSIKVIISTPWWRSWWAYGMYGLILLGLIYSIDRTQKQRVVNAERERTRVRELAQAREIEKAYQELKTTQAQLIQSEKMASLGELTAGIAHEIQNPLNFVNNFSEVNKELLAEMKEAMDNGNLAEAKALANDVIDNEGKINHHGKRADTIVKGMLQHSQSSSNVKEPTDINSLADEYLRLAYHGLRAKEKSFNARLKTDFDKSIGNINIIPQDIGRVMLNLINNALYAVDEKKKQYPEGYEPEVCVSTHFLPAADNSPIRNPQSVIISVKDNGNGIPQKVLDKIFQPFFTTKPTGQGTGLGLSLSYDIVKAHGGEIKVDTKEGEFTEFVVQLPSQ